MVSVSWLAVVIQNAPVHHTYHMLTLQEACVVIYYRPFSLLLEEHSICVP